MDYRSLKGFRELVTNVKLGGSLYWQRKVVRLALGPYDHYLLDGEPVCLSTWLLLLILRLRGRPATLWSHGWYGDEGPLKRLLKRIFFGMAGKVLLYGNHARNLMLKQGFSEEKLVCIYNSLDYPAQRHIRENLPPGNPYHSLCGNDNPVVLFLGRIQPSKKPQLLLEALAISHQPIGKEAIANSQQPIGKEAIANSQQPIGKNINLVLIGENLVNEPQNIKYTSTPQNLPTFLPSHLPTFLTGPIYDEHLLARYICHAAVVVSPGNVGLAAIHALTYGTPVITHDNPAHQGPEFEAITPGVTGDFFREDDAGDLAEKIHHWITISPEKREEVRQACYRKIEEKYTPDYQLKILKELFT